MFRNKELDTLKGLILFAKAERLQSFSYAGFSFDFTGFDPLTEKIDKLEKEVQRLSDITTKLQLTHSFKKAS